MEPAVIGMLCVAAFCGGFTQGLAGFGSTLVALPLLAMVMDMRLAVPVCTTLAVCLNVVLTSRLRGHIQGGTLRLLIVASLPGMPLGAHMLGAVPGYWLKGFLALAILAFVLHTWRGTCSTRPAGRGFGIAAAFLSGCMGGAIGVNGPPIVAWICRQGFDRDAMRATPDRLFPAGRLRRGDLPGHRPGWSRRRCCGARRRPCPPCWPASRPAWPAAAASARRPSTGWCWGCWP